jgi:predicted RNA-binding Zn ribbon-like protein
MPHTIEFERHRPGGSWESEYELTWPVYPYEIQDRPHRSLAALLRARGITWPSGGVFVKQPTDGARVIRAYKPTERSDEILEEVTKLDTASSAALLGFVRKWGLLGVGFPGWEDFAECESVEQARQKLNLLRDCVSFYFTWYGGAKSRTTAERTQGAVGLAETLGALLGRVHPAVRVHAGKFEPFHRVHSLMDAISLQLWMQVTEAKRFRRCPEPICKALFVPGREDQEYCSRACVNRANVRNWRRKRRKPE